MIIPTQVLITPQYILFHILGIKDSAHKRHATNIKHGGSIYIIEPDEIIPMSSCNIFDKYTDNGSK